LLRTEQFYNEYGSRTVIIARFVPVVRTFAPFVAGIGKMPYPRFLVFSSIGSVLWVTICVGAGVFFGEMEFVQKHFEFVVLAVIAISLLPIVFEVLKKKAQQSSPT
jgi:membrane-associated protein